MTDAEKEELLCVGSYGLPFLHSAVASLAALPEMAHHGQLLLVAEKVEGLNQLLLSA